MNISKILNNENENVMKIIIKCNNENVLFHKGIPYYETYILHNQYFLHTLKPKNHNREKNGKTESAASNRCYTKRCSIKSCCNIATLCLWIKILKNEM